MAYQCINYLERVGDNAEKVFKEAVALRCRHVSTASWDQMHRDKTINCNGSGAIALQLSGCLDVGTRMGHVPASSIKERDITSISKAMYNADKIRNCRIIWANKKESDLPFWLRRRGVIYIQYSNCCTSAGMINGKHWIWSCNEEGGYHGGHYDQYKETANRSGVLSCGGHYPFGPKIYVCILPYEKWDQHYAVEVVLGMHGNGQDRIDSLGSAYDKVQGFVNDMCANYEYFLRWCADYLLEMYAGKDSAQMKAVFGKHYDAVKKKASWVINEAQLCWQGKRPSGIRRMAYYGKDYKIVQKQINRSVKGRSFNFSKL